MWKLIAEFNYSDFDRLTVGELKMLLSEVSDSSTFIWVVEKEPDEDHLKLVEIK